MRTEFTCKDCQDRYPGCHDHCAKYQYARQKHYEIKNARQKAQEPFTTGVLKTHRAKLRKFTQNGI